MAQDFYILMSKYNSDCIFKLKQLQFKELSDALLKKCGTSTISTLYEHREDDEIDSIIYRNRCINRIRHRIILKDIILFKKFITQEAHNIINIILNYNVREKFKKIVRIKKIKEEDSTLLLSGDLYVYYFSFYKEIKDIFKSKCKEFTFCIENNILSKKEIKKWNKSVNNLNHIFKLLTSEKYTEFDTYITSKLINRMLINKYIRSDFYFDDETKTSFETNEIISKLKYMNKTLIIDLIKKYVNWYTQTFDGFISRNLHFT